jgi:hypothetical protein
MTRPGRLLLVLLTVVARTSLAGQQQQDTVPAPFVEGGIYDKPYLTTLLGRTALGGYAEAHARLEREDGVTEEFGFEAKRFNLFTSTRVSDFVRIGAEIEIEEGGEEIKLEYAAIDVLMHPAVALRGGMILAPLGRFNLAHDSPRNQFTDRPLVSTEILGVALSEAGLGFLGLAPLRGDARLTYEIYAVNGFGDALILEAPGGTRLPLGRQSFEDGNKSPAFVGRMAVSPRGGWEIGVSAHHGAYNVFEADGLALDDRRDLSIAVLDLELEAVGVRVQGEAARAWIELPASLVGLFAGGQSGFYVEASRDFGRGLVSTMPSSFFTWKARLDAVDFDADRRGDAAEQVSVGLNFRPTSDTAIKLDYVRGRSWDPFNNRADHAAFLFSLATYF